MLELDFDDTFVKHFIGALSHKLIQEFYMLLHAQDFPRIMAMDVFCNIY